MSDDRGWFGNVSVWRVLVYLTIGLLIAVAVTTVIGFVLTQGYLINQGLESRSELSDDYGFAFLLIVTTAISFVASLVGSLVYLLSRNQ